MNVPLAIAREADADPANALNTGDTPPWRHAAFIFLLTASAQLWFVARLGNDIPHWDQWGVEGAALYPSWQDGTFRPADLLAPHSEHRIVFTKALNLALFVANGAWDPLLQLVVGAVLRALAAAAVGWLLLRPLSGKSRRVMAGFVIVGYLPLLAWENVLWGFQSQVSICIGLVAAGFSLVTLRDAPAGRRILGWLLLAAAQYSMGAGLLTIPPLMCWTFLGLRRKQRLELLGILGPTALILIAFFLWAPAPGHDALRPASLGEFLAAFSQILAWPHLGVPAGVLVTAAPLLLFLADQAKRTRIPPIGHDAVILLGAWSLTVSAAIAWSRGGKGTFDIVMPSRYIDLLMVTILCSATTAILLVKAHPSLGRLQTRWAAVGWALFMLVGLAAVAMETSRWVILPRLREPTAHVERALAFQHTNDPAVFSGLPIFFWPNPDLAQIQRVLHDPRLAGRLPPSLQSGLPLGPLSRCTRIVTTHAPAICSLLLLASIFVAFCPVAPLRRLHHLSLGR